MLAKRFSVSPTQTGLLLVATGAAGSALITTVVVAVGLVQPLTVAVTVYVPAASAVTEAIVGFCSDEVKLFGPVQLYVAEGMVLANKLSVCPTQTGVLLDAAGAAGVAFTTTVVVPAGLGAHPGTVAITE